MLFLFVLEQAEIDPNTQSSSCMCYIRFSITWRHRDDISGGVTIFVKHFADTDDVVMLKCDVEVQHLLSWMLYINFTCVGFVHHFLTMWGVRLVILRCHFCHTTNFWHLEYISTKVSFEANYKHDLLWLTMEEIVLWGTSAYICPSLFLSWDQFSWLDSYTFAGFNRQILKLTIPTLVWDWSGMTLFVWICESLVKQGSNDYLRPKRMSRNFVPYLTSSTESNRKIKMNYSIELLSNSSCFCDNLKA